MTESALASSSCSECEPGDLDRQWYRFGQNLGARLSAHQCTSNGKKDEGLGGLLVLCTSTSVLKIPCTSSRDNACVNTLTMLFEATMRYVRPLRIRTLAMVPLPYKTNSQTMLRPKSAPANQNYGNKSHTK